jgi:cbb3-type cytochrome oxidase subunit 1
LVRLYAFFAMTAFAAAYHILPRVTGIEISLRKIKLHFWLAMPGALLMSLPLVLGGILQGLKLADPRIEFLDAAKAALMAFRLTALGELLFLVGALLFCMTTLSMVNQLCRSVIRKAITDEPKLSGTEVRA